MNDPLISVIVPIYKVEQYLDRCIQSIVNQTYCNLEIILVDDGSPDGCPEICDSWANRDNRIKVIHKENGGVSSARNAGLDFFSGDYVSFVDSDDWIEAELYENLLLACINQGAMLAVCGRYVVTGDQKIVDKCSVKAEVLEPAEFAARMLIGDRCDCCVWDKLFHKSLWNEYRFPNGKIYEDIAVMYKPVLKANCVAIVGKPLYNYYRHSNSITKSPFTRKLFDYPNNTRKMLADIRNDYPKLYENACWAHIKALQYVASKIARAQKDSYFGNLGELRSLAKEISSLRTIWLKSEVFSFRDKLLCCFFSQWWSVRSLYVVISYLKELLH